MWLVEQFHLYDTESYSTVCLVTSGNEAKRIVDALNAYQIGIQTGERYVAYEVTTFSSLEEFKLNPYFRYMFEEEPNDDV